MDNKTFIHKLASATGRSAADTDTALERLSGLILRQCSEEGAVAIPGFGTFTGIKHEEETSTDLATGKRILLPPSLEVSFTPGSGLKRAINDTAK